jgi:hypothetical protein
LADIAGKDAEPPVEEVSPKSHPARKAPRALLSCHARCPQGPDLVRVRPARRPPPFDRDQEKTRSLGCYRHALFGLAWFRDKGSIPRLGAGFRLSQATSYRYIDEIIDVLAERAPGLREALERALAEGAPYVILDGKIVDSDRCHEKTLSRKGREIDLWYSGKKKDFGGNNQDLFYPDGKPMWVSDVLPGNVNDLAAARESVLAELRLFAEELPALADGGYEGAGHGVITPVKKPAGMKELDINAALRI